MGGGASKTNSRTPEKRGSSRSISSRTLTPTNSSGNLSPVEGYKNFQVEQQIVERKQAHMAAIGQKNIQEALDEIGKKLYLPPEMVSKCVSSLHNNAIFILEPLRKATKEEWENLGLPIAVARELKEMIGGNASGGRDAGHGDVPKKQLPPLQADLNKNTGLAVPTDARESTSICMECGKPFPTSKLAKHYQLCKQINAASNSSKPSETPEPMAEGGQGFASPFLNKALADLKSGNRARAQSLRGVPGHPRSTAPPIPILEEVSGFNRNEPSARSPTGSPLLSALPRISGTPRQEQSDFTALDAQLASHPVRAKGQLLRTLSKEVESPTSDREHSPSSPSPGTPTFQRPPSRGALAPVNSHSPSHSPTISSNGGPHYSAGHGPPNPAPAQPQPQQAAAQQFANQGQYNSPQQNPYGQQNQQQQQQGNFGGPQGGYPGQYGQSPQSNFAMGQTMSPQQMGYQPNQQQQQYVPPNNGFPNPGQQTNFQGQGFPQQAPNQQMYGQPTGQQNFGQAGFQNPGFQGQTQSFPAQSGQQMGFGQTAQFTNQNFPQPQQAQQQPGGYPQQGMMNYQMSQQGPNPGVNPLANSAPPSFNNGYGSGPGQQNFGSVGPSVGAALAAQLSSMGLGASNNVLGGVAGLSPLPARQLASSAPAAVDNNDGGDHLTVMAKTFKNGDKYSGQFNNSGKQHGRGKYMFANGDVYEGEFQNGYFQGQGIFTRANGDVYTGGFKNDLFHGFGVYSYKDGEKYEGEYVDGERHGHGKYFYRNGNTFEGEFRKGEIVGEGIYTFANGDRFEGAILNGSFGVGKYIFKNGDVYVGQYLGSVPHGQGHVIYANGDQYEGQFKEGRRHGQGKYTYANGKVHEGTYVNGKREGFGKFVDEDGYYEGEFKDGKISGQGVFTFKNGDWYEGEFRNNVFHGYGVMMEKGHKYEGEWVNGNKEGYGKLVTDNGDVYEGEFRDNTMNGKGTYRWSNGNQYKGAFRGGKPHGHGIFYFADTGEQVDGEFRDGNPPEGSRRIDNTQTPGGGGVEKWKVVQEKLTPKTYTRVHMPYLGQHSDALF